VTDRSRAWTASNGLAPEAPSAEVRPWFAFGDLYWLVVWLGQRVSYLLPVPLQVRLARSRGLVWGRAAEAAAARRNIAEILGVTDRRAIDRIVRRHFQYLAEYELSRVLPALGRRFEPDDWPVEGLEHLDAALEEGRGVILLISHFGFCRMIQPILGGRGYRVLRVGAKLSSRIKAEEEEARHVRDQSAFRRFLYDRLYVAPNSAGQKDLIADINIRPIVEVLRRNGIVLLAGDAQHAVQFACLPLLGRSYPFPMGYARMALETGARVLPTFGVDTPEGGGVKIVIEKPLELTGQPSSAAVLQAVQSFAGIFEAHVRRHPYLFNIWTKDGWFERRLERSRKKLARRF
jgi:KDO2-lipid IV(A) lauroyltransferase